MPLPGQSYDALFFSFVIHEIRTGQRLRVLKAILERLVPGGKVFLREPLHFIREPELRQLARECGLAEISCSVREVKTQGLAFEGVFQKKGKWKNGYLAKIPCKSRGICFI
jgi:hypothetical protein